MPRAVAGLLFLSCCSALPATAPSRAEILWDRFGVPHIYAADFPSLFFAYGWAQMSSHGNLLLRLYGESRGRAAEYWGPSEIENDRWMLTNGVPERGREWLRAQTPEFRRCLEEFAAGINAYATLHPEQIDPEVLRVAPVNAADVLAHAQRVVHFGIVFPGGLRNRLRREYGDGSNAWAVAPSRTASGHAMLLMNPHLAWGGSTTYYEAHLNAPGFNLYGAAQVGIPVLRLAFNDALGWTSTNNPIDIADLYELELVPGGYRWNEGVRQFEVERRRIAVRGGAEETLTIRKSVHGPVIATSRGRAIALRMAGLDQAGMLDQYWRMGRARSMIEFTAQLSRLQIPAYNMIYADRAGHILHLFNGQVPVRPRGVSDWNWIVPGRDSTTLWTRTHAYDDLPRVIDPPGGFLQNANDPPWFNTLPPVLDPSKYPDYMAPKFMHFRAQRSLKLISEARKITLEELIKRKHVTRVEMADHILDDLLAAARKTPNARVQKAADLLESWDRSMDRESVGAALFEAWTREWNAPSSFTAGDRRWFAEAWEWKRPLETPRGIADHARAIEALTRAIGKVEADHGRLDIGWGDVLRIDRDGVNLPAPGGPGTMGLFRTLNFAVEGTRYRVVSGDSWVAAVEFGRPVKAWVLIGYGNASQPGSSHRTDQLEFVSGKRLRQAWLTRAEIEQNLGRKETL